MVSNVLDDLSAESLSFANNFWVDKYKEKKEDEQYSDPLGKKGYDRRGMDALLGQIQASFDVLSRLQTIYYERAQLEQEFGQNLMTLCAADEDEEQATEGLVNAMKSVNMELKKTGQSHIDLARRLKEQVASELDQWLIERGEAIDTVRDQYLRLHQSSTGPTTQLQVLEKEYRTMLTAIEDTVDQWNSTWKQTCDELELIEVQRIDFIIGNVWDYANLTTAQFMVQDEWCEKIRSSLEALDVKTELARYMQHRTGSTIPSASDYILHAVQSDTLELPPMKTKQLPPRPLSSISGSTMSGTTTTTTTTTAAARVKRKPLPTLQERKKKENRGSLEELLDRLEISPSNKQNHDSVVPASSLGCTSKTQREPEQRDEEQIDNKKKKKELEYRTRRLESSHELMRTLSQATSTLSNEPTQACMQSAAASSVPPTTQAGFMYHPPKSPRPSAQGLKKPDQQDQEQGQAAEDHRAIHPSHAFPMATTPTTGTIPSHYHHYPPTPAPPSPLPFSPSPPSQGWGVPVPMTLPPSSPAYGPLISSSLSNGGLLPSSLSSAPSPMMQAQDRTIHTPSSPMMLPSSSPSSAQGRPYYAPSSPMVMMATPAGYPTNSTVIGPSSALPTSSLLPMLSPRPPAAGTTAVSMSSCYPSPCPSPRMMTNQSSSSSSSYPPPPPATGLPVQLADGRPIMHWARAKYDYIAQDEIEISFSRGTLLAVYGYSTFEGWMMAEVWDESSQRWCGSGCVPGNYIQNL